MQPISSVWRPLAFLPVTLSQMQFQDLRRGETLEYLWFGPIPGDSDGEESACNVGDLGSIPRWGRSPGEGNCPLQHSGLENPMNCRVNGTAKSQTRLSHFSFHFFTLRSRRETNNRAGQEMPSLYGNIPT